MKTLGLMFLLFYIKQKIKCSSFKIYISIDFLCLVFYCLVGYIYYSVYYGAVPCLVLSVYLMDAKFSLLEEHC